MQGSRIIKALLQAEPVGRRAEEIREVAAEGAVNGDQCLTLRPVTRDYPVAVPSPINSTAFSHKPTYVSCMHT